MVPSDVVLLVDTLVVVFGKSVGIGCGRADSSVDAFAEQRHDRIGNVEFSGTSVYLVFEILAPAFSGFMGTGEEVKESFGVYITTWTQYRGRRIVPVCPNSCWQNTME